MSRLSIFISDDAVRTLETVDRRSPNTQASCLSIVELRRNVLEVHILFFECRTRVDFSNTFYWTGVGCFGLFIYHDLLRRKLPPPRWWHPALEVQTFSLFLFFFIFFLVNTG